MRACEKIVKTFMSWGSACALPITFFLCFMCKLSGKNIELFLTNVKNKKKENPFAKGFSFFYN